MPSRPGAAALRPATGRLEIDEALDAGEMRNIKITFDRAGTFRLYCIPHEALGMVGKIVVQ